MRVGSEGVGGVPHDAGGGRGAQALAGADAPANAAQGGFLQLLTLLQGGPVEPGVDKAGGTGEDADEAKIDGEGATDVAALEAAAAAAAAEVAGVVVKLSSGHAGPATHAPSSGTAAAHSQAADPNVVRAASDGGGAKASSVVGGVKPEAGSVAATGPAVGGGDAGARVALVQVLRGAGDAQVGAQRGGSGLSATRGTRATAHARVAARGRVGVPPVASDADPSADEAGAPVHDRAATAAADEDAAIAEPEKRPGADGAGHAREAQAHAPVEVDAEPATDPTPPQAGGKSIPTSPEHAREGAMAPPGGGESTPGSHELGGASHLVADASGAARSAPEVPRASIASGAVPGLPSWIERLASANRLGAGRKGEALHFDLEPSGLGRIEVRLSIGRDGLRTQIFTEHEHTRSLLANQQSQLAAAFERNDLRLESFLVDVGVGGEAGRDARHEASDVNAFDQTGLVSAAAGEETAAEALPVAGLVSVRA